MLFYLTIVAIREFSAGLRGEIQGKGTYTK
jgi:hypothetical protein